MCSASLASQNQARGSDKRTVSSRGKSDEVILASVSRNTAAVSSARWLNQEAREFVAKFQRLRKPCLQTRQRSGQTCYRNCGLDGYFGTGGLSKRGQATAKSMTGQRRTRFRNRQFEPPHTTLGKILPELSSHLRRP